MSAKKIKQIHKSLEYKCQFRYNKRSETCEDIIQIISTFEIIQHDQIDIMRIIQKMSCMEDG
jgi:hypothetical protein